MFVLICDFCILLQQILIEKVKKRLRLFVDNELMKKVKAPRKMNVGRELFLGSLPSNVDRPESMQVLTMSCDIVKNDYVYSYPENSKFNLIQQQNNFQPVYIKGLCAVLFQLSWQTCPRSFHLEGWP